MEPVFTVIRYHVWWPGPNDPFYLFNTPEVQARRNYYAVPYVPYCQFDGAISGGSAYGSWPAIVDGRSLLNSVLQIDLTGEYDENTNEGEVTVSIYAEETPGVSNLRLRVVLTESNLSYGNKLWHQTFRDMIPSPYGQPITITQGETVEHTFDFTTPSPMIGRNVMVVAFVQSESNREILQSAKVGATELQQTSIDDEIETPNEFALGQNYPNPFNATTKINFNSQGGATNLSIYDITGSLVKTLVDGSVEAGSHSIIWDGRDASGADVSSGVYFYRLSDSHGKNVRRMTLLK